MDNKTQIFGLFICLSINFDLHIQLLLKTRRVTRGRGGGEVSPALFQKLGKSALICGKKCPECGHLWVKFSFKMQFLRVSRRKIRIFFPCGAFLSSVIGEFYRSALISRKLPALKNSWLRAWKLFIKFHIENIKVKLKQLC